MRSLDRYSRKLADTFLRVLPQGCLRVACSNVVLNRKTPRLNKNEVQAGCLATRLAIAHSLS
jgi:hypothetical protein